MMSQFLRIFLCGVVVFGATACGGSDPTNANDSRELNDAGMSSDGLEDDDGGIATNENADAEASIERSVNSVLPNRVPRSGGTSIRIIGLGFSDDLTLTIGTARCLELSVQSETQATCVVPEMTLGRKNLIMRWAESGHVRELRDAIEVYEPLTLGSLQPDRGHVGGGQLVWLSGSGFTETARVFVGGERAEIIRVIDGGRSIRLQVPPGQPGEADVVVENINGRAVIESGFTYFEPLVLDEVTPRVSGADGVDRVILRGAGLAESSQVWFGAVQAEVLASLLERQRLDVRIPPNTASGLVDVRVENAGGTAVMEEAFFFLSESSAATSPSVDQILPMRLPVNVFSTIYVAGNGFTEGLTVSSNGRTLDCNLVDTSLVTCTIQQMRVGTDTLTITDVQTDLASTWEIEFYQSVDLVSINPRYGSQSGGTLVEVEGLGFTENTQFWLGESPLEIVSVSDGLVTGRTTSSQPGLVDLRADNEADTALLVGVYEYLDPLLTLGGVSGEEIRNNINVTVMDIYTNEPIDNAQVVVQGLTTNRIWRAFSDERGQVTIGDEALELPAAVTAAKSGYFTETLNRVTAEDTTLLLIPTTPPESEPSGGGGDGEPYPIIRGRLEGLSGLKKPDQEGLTVAAFIESSTIVDGNGEAINPIPEPFLMLEDGPFSFDVEPGEFAVIGMAGYLEVAKITEYQNGITSIEELRKSLQPTQMGAARHIMVDMGDERDNVVVRLTVPMKQEIAVDFDNPPAGVNGPNRFSLDVVLDLQSDGYYDLRFVQQGQEPEFEFRSLPDLNLLSGVKLDWTGEAIKVPLFSLGGIGDDAQFRTRSTSWVSTDRNQATLTVSPFVGSVDLGPRSIFRGEELDVSWSVHDGYSGQPTEPADCHFLILYQNYEPVWISVVPGAANEIELPAIMAAEGVDAGFGSGEPLHMMIESYIFSSAFSYRDFSLYDVLGMGTFDSMAFSFGQIQ